MVGRGRVVAILRIAIMRSDSRFDARGGKANLHGAAEKRLHDEQRRDKGDAGRDSREETRRGPRSDLYCSRRHGVTGPVKKLESDMRRPEGDSRFLVGKRPNIDPQGRFSGADLLHDSFSTTVAPRTHSPRAAGAGPFARVEASARRSDRRGARCFDSVQGTGRWCGSTGECPPAESIATTPSKRENFSRIAGEKPPSAPDSLAASASATGFTMPSFSRLTLDLSASPAHRAMDQAPSLRRKRARPPRSP